ncbi:MAG: hypothetical protein ACLPYB_00095 [Desulfobaccales bacterium]
MLGRLLSLILITVGGGLLQLWVLVLIIVNTGGKLNIGSLLGDGGLFFFATTLAFHSFLILIDHEPLRIGSSNLNITLLLVGPVMVTSMVTYASVLSIALGKIILPFSNHLAPQIICSLCALTYAFYVGTVTSFGRR